jgi:hypothetical protein
VNRSCSENNTGNAAVSAVWIGNDSRINPKGEAGETAAFPGNSQHFHASLGESAHENLHQNHFNLKSAIW